MITITVPSGVKAQVSENEIIVEGPKGKVSKSFNPHQISIEKSEEGLVLKSEDISLLNTFKSHIYNMIKGVTEGHTAKMRVVYSHFPINLEVRDGVLVIKNFLGEKVPRKAKIVGNTKLDIKGQEIFISGTNKEHVGQTVSNIRAAVRIPGKDCRVFQDGIYLEG
ncbi:MAG: 50S ribosomal protein L6 [Candidatus Micrarchaeia archaeon]